MPKPKLNDKVASLVLCAQRYAAAASEYLRIRKSNAAAIEAKPCLKPTVTDEHTLFCWTVHPKDQPNWCENCRANFQIASDKKRAAARRQQCLAAILKAAKTFPSESAQRRFESDPAFRREVTAAFYSYHLSLTQTQHAHNFCDHEEDAICTWCRRSRPDVRWNKDVDPRCEKRPWQIDKPIRFASEQTHEWLQRAQTYILGRHSKDKLDGIMLARIEVTFGFSPREVQEILAKDLRHLLPEYESEMKFLKPVIPNPSPTPASVPSPSILSGKVVAQG